MPSTMHFLRSRAFARTALTLALSALAASAHAADFTLDGRVHLNTDVVEVTFRLDADATDVKVWTDSWQGGLNYDPTAAVWVQRGGGYTLLGEVDDDGSIGPGQGSFDAGLRFASLAQGRYLVTIAASPNFAVGPTLADGFSFATDGTVPTPIATWNQPSYDINADDQKGTYWRLNLSGVSAAAAVPEPSTWAQLALGLALCGAAARRRRRG